MSPLRHLCLFFSEEKVQVYAKVQPANSDSRNPFPPTGGPELVKLHDSFEAVVGEGFPDGAAALLSQAGHAVGVAALLRPGLDVHGVGRLAGRVHVKVVVRPQEDTAAVPHRHRVGDVLGVRDVEEARGDPGHQILGQGQGGVFLKNITGRSMTVCESDVLALFGG